MKKVQNLNITRNQEFIHYLYERGHINKKEVMIKEKESTRYRKSLDDKGEKQRTLRIKRRK